MSGWIKIHRKIMESNMYNSLNSKQRDVMFACLLLANFEQKTWEWEGKLYTCEPGQFITSIESLKKCCAKDVSSRNTRTALSKLETWCFLTMKSTNSGRLITICNWDTYQNDFQETDKPTDRQVTNDRQTTDKRLTTTKNIKNIKNERIKEIIPPFIPPSLEEFQKHGFDYAMNYFNFPVSKEKVYALLHNSYEYWTEQNWLRDKKPMKSWQKTVENKIRSEVSRIKDYDTARKQEQVDSEKHVFVDWSKK